MRALLATAGILGLLSAAGCGDGNAPAGAKAASRRTAGTKGTRAAADRHAGRSGKAAAGAQGKSAGRTPGKGSKPGKAGTKAPAKAEEEVMKVAFDLQVSDGGDDAEEDDAGALYVTSSDLELVKDDQMAGKTSQKVGIRFASVSVPHGARITRAYLQFQVDELSDEETRLTIRGEASDDAPAFDQSRKRNISSRPLTKASLGWSPPPWREEGESGEKQRTGDLAAVIQEIIDRAGWKHGHALVLVVTGRGKRTAESYEGSDLAAPRLRVEFTYAGKEIFW